MSEEFTQQLSTLSLIHTGQNLFLRMKLASLIVIDGSFDLLCAAMSCPMFPIAPTYIWYFNNSFPIYVGHISVCWCR